MAKQIGPIKLRGCYGNICFYKMDGEYYARQKSSLDRKRVKRDPAFRETMRYSGIFGRASKLASAVYKTLLQEEKASGLFKSLTGRAMQLLSGGKTEKEVLEVLQAPKVEISPAPAVAKKKNSTSKDSFADEVLLLVFSETAYAAAEENIYCFEDAPP